MAIGIVPGPLGRLPYGVHDDSRIERIKPIGMTATRMAPTLVNRTAVVKDGVVKIEQDSGWHSPIAHHLSPNHKRNLRRLAVDDNA